MNDLTGESAADVPRAPSTFKSTRLLAWAATYGIALSVVMTAVVTVLELVQNFAFPDWEAQLLEDNTSAIFFVASLAWGSLGYVAVLITSAVIFCYWLYRVAQNARVIGHRRPTTHPTMAVLCWFIPIVHLVQPYRVMKALYWASEPAEQNVPGDWVRRTPALFPVWWATWVISGLLGNAAMGFTSSLGLAKQGLAMWVEVASFPLVLTSALGATAVLWSIQVRQERLAEESATLEAELDDAKAREAQR